MRNIKPLEKVVVRITLFLSSVVIVQKPSHLFAE